MQTAEKDTVSDEELAINFSKTRNLDLFEELYTRFSENVFNSCIYFLKNEQYAEDATQDVFLKLFININKFSGKSKFSTWLNAMTYNHCINVLSRDKEKNIFESAVQIDDESFVVDHIDDERIYGMQFEILERALEQIEDKEKMILLLKYRDNMSIKTLAHFFEIGESATKMRLSRAKQSLLTKYKSVENEY